MVQNLAMLTASPMSFALLLLACGYLVVIAVPLSIIDARSHRLPDRIVYPSILIALLLLTAACWLRADPAAALRTGLGGLVLGAGYLLLRLLYPAGMGLGDVKLAVLLGLYLAYLSWPHLFYGTVLTFLLGGFFGLMLILSRRGRPDSAIPFGPFMLAGTMLALLLPA